MVFCPSGLAKGVPDCQTCQKFNYTCKMLTCKRVKLLTHTYSHQYNLFCGVHPCRTIILRELFFSYLLCSRQFCINSPWRSFHLNEIHCFLFENKNRKSKVTILINTRNSIILYKNKIISKLTLESFWINICTESNIRKMIQ